MPEEGDVRLADRIHLDANYVAGLEELAPCVGAAVGSGEAGHSRANHLLDWLPLKLSGNDRGLIPDGDYATTIKTRHRQFGRVGFGGNLCWQLRGCKTRAQGF